MAETFGMHTALWLSCCLAASAATAKTTPPHASVPASALKGIKVQSAGGGIKVRGIRTEAIAIDSKQTLGGSSCKLSTQIADGVLVIMVAEANSAPCQIDLDIGLPRRLDVEIRDDAGNIFVSGVEGGVVLNLGQGNAVLGGKIKRLKAELTRGSLSAQGLLGDADVTLTAGNAQLWYAATSPATVLMEVERGNVTVGSNAAAVDLQVNAETGQIQNALPQSPDASLHLKGHIAHGNVIVRAGRSP